MQLSYVTEDELFKICLDFWHFFSQDIYNKLKDNNLLNNGKYHEFLLRWHFNIVDGMNL